jgi:hypothetical protein
MLVCKKCGSSEVCEGNVVNVYTHLNTGDEERGDSQDCFYYCYGCGETTRNQNELVKEKEE